MKVRLTRISVVFVLCVTAWSARAESHLDRLEGATMIISVKTKALFAAQAPELANLLPDPTWDDAMREAMACYLNEIERAAGEAAMKAFVTEYESFAQQEFTNMKALLNTPAPLPDQELLKANQTCGIIELSQKRMEESGYTKVFTDPELMKKLTELMSKTD